MAVAKTRQSKSKQTERTERRRDQTRIEILDAARDSVLAEGLRGLSLASVADRLGLTKPALYYYFASKEVLTFELFLREWIESATEVAEAVARTETGADAVEQLMRAFYARYRQRIDLYMLAYMMAPTTIELSELVGPDELLRIRPVNGLLYGGAEARLLADQSAGKFPKQRNPRRFAFSAHLAVMGLLNMEAIAHSAKDPLIHGGDELIDDLCQTFREAATKGASK